MTQSSLNAGLQPNAVHVIPERLTEYRHLVMRETGTRIPPWRREIAAYIADGKQPPTT